MTYYEMNPEREAHLERVKKDIADRIDEQYRKGQRENGGDLWNKFDLRGIIEQAYEEVIDQAVYLKCALDKLDKEGRE